MGSKWKHVVRSLLLTQALTQTAESASPRQPRQPKAHYRAFMKSG